MELKQLRHFLTAAKHRRIHAAATKLNMSQSALTRSLQTLEESLGVPLLERDSRGVRLTVYGESLAAHARIILNETQKTLNELGALSGGSRVAVSVGATPNYSSTIIAGAVTRLVKDRPNVKITVEEGSLTQLLPRLRIGELDLLLMLTPSALREPEITFEALGTEELAIVVRHGHPLTKVRKPTVDDLAKASWILSFQQGFEPDKLRILLSQRLHPAEGGIIYAQSIPLRLRTVMASELLTIVPIRSCANELKNKSLARIYVPEFETESIVGLIYAKRRRQLPAVLELARRIKAVHAEEAHRIAS